MAMPDLLSLARQGRFGPEEGFVWIEARGPALLELMQAASALRDEAGSIIQPPTRMVRASFAA